MDNKSHEEPLFQRGASQDDSFYDTIDKSPEYDNEVNNSSSLSPEEKAQQDEQMRSELAKLEEEIQTLRSVLSTKQREASVIKHQLGITPYTEMRKDLSVGVTNLKESNTYQKTNQAFRTFGSWSSKKLGDVRNSNSFKSFEEKMGGAYSTVKTKISGSQSEQNFDEALRAASAENGSATSPSSDKGASASEKA